MIQDLTELTDSELINFVENNYYSVVRNQAGIANVSYKTMTRDDKDNEISLMEFILWDGRTFTKPKLLKKPSL